MYGERVIYQKGGVPFDSPSLQYCEMRFYDQIPSQYRKSVEEGFAKASDDILTVSKIYSSSLKGVRSTALKAIISDNRLIRPVSHYDFTENCIYMDESKSEEEYMRTFRHEYGHFIDYSLGKISETSEFVKAFEEDAQLYDVSKDDGIRRLNDLQMEIADNIHAFASEYVTDIISALTRNDTAFIRKYTENATQTSPYDLFYYEKMEGAGMSGHTDLYWDDGPHMSRQKEAFADLFAIWTENNPIVQEFVRDHFPNLSGTFEKIIRTESKK